MKEMYSWRVILLSFGVAFLGSYCAITACEQYRLTRIGIVQSRFVSSILYLLIMAVCLGGVGIFCMHFIGMSALKLEDHEGNNVPIRYNIGMTVLSLIMVLMFSTLGFYIGSHDQVFMKTKKQIVDMFVLDSEHMSMKKIKHISPYQVLSIILTRKPQHLLAGGLVTGSGVVVMHYIGMYAMVFPGHIVWDAGIIAASCIIAFIASTAAFWILFRLLSIYPNKENLRIMCALTMAIAVCGMHYCGMGAAKMVLDPDTKVENHTSFDTYSTFFAGVLSAAIVATVAIMIALGDLRNSVLKLAYELGRADELVLSIPVAAGSSLERTVSRYILQRKLSQFSLGILNETYRLDEFDGDYDDLSVKKSDNGTEERSIHVGGLNMHKRIGGTSLGGGGGASHCSSPRTSFYMSSAVTKKIVPTNTNTGSDSTVTNGTANETVASGSSTGHGHGHGAGGPADKYRENSVPKADSHDSKDPEEATLAGTVAVSVTGGTGSRRASGSGLASRTGSGTGSGKGENAHGATTSSAVVAAELFNGAMGKDIESQ
jgi:NO-binding membrane sensor protein with MHYT domain